jgi:hypothetical protein
MLRRSKERQEHAGTVSVVVTENLAADEVSGKLGHQDRPHEIIVADSNTFAEST